MAPASCSRCAGPFFLHQQTARKPNSVLDSHSSRRRIAATLQRPTRGFWRAGPARLQDCSCSPRLFGLAPCGVYPAAAIAGVAVRSYRTFSPLPESLRALAVRFLWHLPSCTFLRCSPGRYPAHCPAEFGLSSPGLNRQQPSNRLLYLG